MRPGAGERTADMAEQLVLDQLDRETPTIHRDTGGARSAA
jgi:hypothetical protein